VVVVGQRIDDRHRRRRGERVQIGLGERAHDDRRGLAGEDARGVGERLAAAELQLVRSQHHGEHPEPPRRGLETRVRVDGLVK
jgi:hypothetical protein